MSGQHIQTLHQVSSSTGKTAAEGHAHLVQSHFQEPAELTTLLEVVPEDADTANPDKYGLKWHNQPKHLDKEVTFHVQGYLVDFHLPPILQLDQSSLKGIDYHGMLPGQSRWFEFEA
ncbi:hypothetical protein K439DRAFT_1613974 [Ramaria rubella]|nr:hypothetical protein K439DRAFT_1613974 [Ramaria rubella]